jgi:putative membrane protein
MTKQNGLSVVYLCACVMILLVSYVFSRDKLIWVLEVFPILLGLPILLLTCRKFRFTNFLYFFLVIHISIMAVGAIYTYAKVPFGFWMQEWFGFSRNHYDRIGHFAQGFVPALLTREMLLRTSPLRRGKWLFFIVVCVCLAVSALYELMEFGYAVLAGESSESFLGSQGDVWDAQWDMSFALIGSIAAMVFMPKLHDRFLMKISVDVRN